MDRKRYPLLADVAAPGEPIDLQQAMASDDPAAWVTALQSILDREIHNADMHKMATGFLEEISNVIR